MPRLPRRGSIPSLRLWSSTSVPLKDGRPCRSTRARPSRVSAPPTSAIGSPPRARALTSRR
eukprot:11046095-Lingulodinium_polyedra.AAC.1